VLSAFSSPQSYSPEQPVVARDPMQRPGAALDHFFMRRRSSTIGIQFWNFIAREWQGFDPIERTRSARLFSRYRPYWTPGCLSLEDRAFYDSLPKRFTAYRGQNGVELAAGGSFTLSEAAARLDALGRRKISYADPTVLALVVMKADVALAFATRRETEIVLFPTLANSTRSEAMRSAHLTH
jgi:hypothetical protein